MGAHMGTIRDSLGDEILAHAKPITKLQMEDVRRMHECWVKMECNPGVDQKRFNKIFVMLRGANQRKLFELFAKGPPDRRFADVNEVFAVALINSSAFAASKMRALFELYDEDCSGELSLQEVVIRAAQESEIPNFTKAPFSAVFHSFRLIFGRAIIFRNGLEAWMLFPERARAEHSR